jgi:hypothetical protein
MKHKKRQLTVSVQRGERSGYGEKNPVWVDTHDGAGRVELCYIYGRKLFGPLRIGQTKRFTVFAKETDA